MKYYFIKGNLNNFRVGKMVKIFNVSKSGYYKWGSKSKSKRSNENEQYLLEIKKIHKASKEIYGCPKVLGELKNRGHKVNHKRICRIMRENGIRSKVKRKFKITTHSNHKLPVAPDLLKGNFNVESRNRTWVSDITYLWTVEGWLYLAIVLDLYNRKCVGWWTSDSLKKEIVINAFLRANKNENPKTGLIFHSDKGSQYASKEFRKILLNQNISQSMAKGGCYDNAVAESFFRSLKTEMVYRTHFKTRDEAKLEIFQYIEIFYNRERLHSYLGYKTPVEYGKEIV